MTVSLSTHTELLAKKAATRRRRSSGRKKKKQEVEVFYKNTSEYNINP